MVCEPELLVWKKVKNGGFKAFKAKDVVFLGRGAKAPLK